MKKFTADFVLIASTLIFIVSVTIYITNRYRTSKDTPTNSQNSYLITVYKNEQGYPKYALGDCRSDAECIPAGCSEQICSNDPDLATTCEVRSDFPDKNSFSCGCIENLCLWYRE